MVVEVLLRSRLSGERSRVRTQATQGRLISEVKVYVQERCVYPRAFMQLNVNVNIVIFAIVTVFAILFIVLYHFCDFLTPALNRNGSLQ